MGGREHTEVRALDPGRSTFSCLALSLVYFLYKTITGRRKESSDAKNQSHFCPCFVL